MSVKVLVTSLLLVNACRETEKMPLKHASEAGQHLDAVDELYEYLTDS